jgi:hypothetical protein
MRALYLLSVGTGVCLLVASVFWSKIDNGKSSWTEEKAAAYQEVSARLHGLSFRDLSKEENKSLFDKAQSEYEVLDTQLQHARTRGSRTAFWLKVAGGVLAVIGGVGVFMQRDAS